MFLIDRHGKRPVCASCHRLGPCMQETAAVFVCEACAQAVEDNLRTLAEAIPELRDHRLKRWRKGCECALCHGRANRAV